MEKLNSVGSTKLAMQTSTVSIIVNIILSVGKLIAGILSHSAAMISDAIHSASDVISTFIVIIGVRISARQSDDEHPYGHERFESMASIVLATLLAATGLGVGYSGLASIIHNDYTKNVTPGIIALIAAAVSIVVKEWMFHYTNSVAKVIKSDALRADAWHHRSDALSSVGALIGIGASRLGFALGDSIASIIICIFILKAAVDIFRDASDKLVDKSCPEEVEKAMRASILAIDGVQRLDLLNTRLFGSKIYVDVEISADGNKPLYETHAIAEAVHKAIEENFEDVKHCMVHVNPL